MVDFFVDAEKIRDVQNRLLDFADGMDKAFNVAFEETITQTTRRSTREVKTLVSIIRSEDEYIKAIPELSDQYLGRECNLKLLDRSVPLRAFKARQTPEGVEVQLTSAGISSKFYKGAFGPKIAKLGGNIYRRAGKKRFPIVKLANLNVSQIEGVPETFKQEVQSYRVAMVQRFEKKKKELIQEFGKGIVYAASQT